MSLIPLHYHRRLIGGVLGTTLSNDRRAKPYDRNNNHVFDIDIIGTSSIRILTQSRGRLSSLRRLSHSPTGDHYNTIYLAPRAKIQVIITLSLTSLHSKFDSNSILPAANWHPTKLPFQFPSTMLSLLLRVGGIGDGLFVIFFFLALSVLICAIGMRTEKPGSDTRATPRSS